MERTSVASYAYRIFVIKIGLLDLVETVEFNLLIQLFWIYSSLNVLNIAKNVPLNFTARYIIMYQSM